MRKISILILLIDLVLIVYMLFSGNYIYAVAFISGAILLLYFIGRLSSRGYIENALLGYIKKQGEVSKEELVDYLRLETQGRANVDINEVVEDVLARLTEKRTIVVCNNMISIQTGGRTKPTC